MFGKTFPIKKCLLAVSLFGILWLESNACVYTTFVFKGHLTQVLDNYAKLTGTDIAVGSPFTGYFTYEITAKPSSALPWTGNCTYKSVQAFRFTVHTAKGNYEFGYVNSSDAYYQVDVRNYDKLWWKQSGISGLIAKTDIPSQQGTYNVGFNLSNNAGNIWSVPYPLPKSLNVNDFDFRELSFQGNYDSNTIDFGIIGQLDLAQVPVPTNSGPVCLGGTVNLHTNAIAGASYVWTGPKNFHSTLQNPVISGITLADIGSYSVTATTIYGLASAATTITVKTLPVVPVILGDNSMCPQQANTTLNTGSYATYLWTPGGETTQSITINAPATYTVIVTDAFGCSGSSLPLTVSIRSLPSDFNFDGFVDISDYLIFSGKFSRYCTCAEDLNQDGFVSIDDYLTFVRFFDKTCK